MNGNPIAKSDPDGDDARVEKKPNENGSGGAINISTKVHAKGGTAEERKRFVDVGNAQVTAMKLSGKMNGSYKDEKGGVWNITLNLEFVDEGVAFEDGDNTMDLSKLNDPKTNRSSVFANDIQERVFRNGKWSVTGNYTSVNRAGNQGEMRGGMAGLIGPTEYHESMHFMGLSDRYETTTLTVHPGYQDDVMASGAGNGNQSKFNQNHWNNWGKAALSNPDSKFILRQRVDIQGTEKKTMLPENYETKNGAR